MSKIKDIIQRVDKNKPNAFSEELKLQWISQLDGKIALDVMLMDVSELHQFQYNFPEDLEKETLVSFPHEDMYEHWLEANIDAQNGEYSRYQNSMEFYNASYDNFVNWFLSRYEPGRGCECQRNGTPSYYISAYGLAVKHGFSGDPEAWLASLSAYGLAVAQGFEGDLQAWLASLKGEKGDKGDPGGKLVSGEGVDSIVRVVSDAAEKPEAQPTATGESAISLGRYCRAPGKNAMAVNYTNVVKGAYGFAANNNNTIGENARSSSAFGSGNVVNAIWALVMGRFNTIDPEAEGGFVAGLRNSLSVPYGARFGKWGTVDSPALFAVGNGTENSLRSNAFEVFEDGSIAINGVIFTADEIREAISQIAGMNSLIEQTLSNQIRTNTILLGSDTNTYASAGYKGMGWEFVDGVDGSVRLSASDLFINFSSTDNYMILKVNDSFCGERTVNIFPSRRSRVGNSAEVYAMSEEPSDVRQLSVDSDSFVGIIDTYYADSLQFRKELNSNSFYLVFKALAVTDAPSFAIWFRLSKITTSLATIPVILHGTDEPDNTIGKDGDIYIMHEEVEKG